MEHDPARLRALFDEVMQAPPDARAALLASRCGTDAELKRRVEALIAAAEADDPFLSDPTRSKPPLVETPSIAATPLSEKPGTRIGPYKLLQVIGEGGFGVVFMADQDQPVRRRVALKIIKLGMDTRQVVARFEQERQALALMDHPHIARVFDAGATESGRPFFVMEYVVGDPITAFADAHMLSVRQRLDLLEQVCSAVQHAHTKGVIHRDIKPRNVLVSMVDGKPFAKVIDFGIAKATGARLTEMTLFTEHRQLVGTPEYMSPEQAEGSPDIDTRTDVYALGVLLYELLTGATPFDAKRLRSAAFAEMQRIIKEEEPPAPSVRLSRSLETLAATAAARQAEPGRLGALIKGELDWIVMKSLDKDRARRYETPNQLAADVRRHLTGEPVVAAPPSAAYRLRKFVRKHKTGVVAGGTVAAALLLGITGTTWQWNAARRANRELFGLYETARSALANTFLFAESSRSPEGLRVKSLEWIEEEGGNELFSARIERTRRPNDEERAAGARYEYKVDVHGPNNSELSAETAIRALETITHRRIRETIDAQQSLESANAALKEQRDIAVSKLKDIVTNLADIGGPSMIAITEPDGKGGRDGFAIWFEEDDEGNVHRDEDGSFTPEVFRINDFSLDSRGPVTLAQSIEALGYTASMAIEKAVEARKSLEAANTEITTQRGEAVEALRELALGLAKIDLSTGFMPEDGVLYWAGMGEAGGAVVRVSADGEPELVFYKRAVADVPATLPIQGEDGVNPADMNQGVVIAILQTFIHKSLEELESQRQLLEAKIIELEAANAKLRETAVAPDGPSPAPP